jgi:hypothetical protein
LKAAENFTRKLAADASIDIGLADEGSPEAMINPLGCD